MTRALHVWQAQIPADAARFMRRSSSKRGESRVGTASRSMVGAGVLLVGREAAAGLAHALFEIWSVAHGDCLACIDGLNG